MKESSYILDLTAAHARTRDLEMRELIGHQEYLKMKARAEHAEAMLAGKEAGEYAESFSLIDQVASHHRDIYAHRTHDDAGEPLCTV